MKHHARARTSAASVSARAHGLIAVLLGSAAAWLALTISTWPALQDVPLIDDWAFGRSALVFAESARIDYMNWASMPELGQWLWACPFVWLLGPSYLALRISAIVLSWLGLVAFYDLLRQQSMAPNQAALATAALAFNPLFFLLQGTFMTDVPALSLSLIALALYGRALGGRAVCWGLGAVAALLAVTTRQNSLAAPAAVGVLLVRDPVRRRQLVGWIAVIVPIAAGLATHAWFQNRPDALRMIARLQPPDSMLLLPFVLVHSCGLVAVPVLLGQKQRWSKGLTVAATLMLVMAAYWMLQEKYLPFDGLWPYLDGGVITPAGPGGVLMQGEAAVVFSAPARGLLTLLGCIAGAILLVRLCAMRGDVGLRHNVLFVFTLFQIPLVLIVVDLYDRYLLFFLPAASLLAALTGRIERCRYFVGVSAIVLEAAFSMAMMHDWLSWRSASWALGSQAVASGVDPADIEGGLEWDGWWSSSAEPLNRSLADIVAQRARESWSARGLTLRNTRIWFPEVRGRYALSFSVLKGARVLESRTYHCWLPPFERQFFLLAYVPATDSNNGAPKHH